MCLSSSANLMLGPFTDILLTPLSISLGGRCGEVSWPVPSAEQAYFLGSCFFSKKHTFQKKVRHEEL